MRFFLSKENYGTYNAGNPFAHYDPSMAAYYPITGGLHIGTDWGIRSATPIFAPADGQILVATLSAPKGNVGVYDFTDGNGVEWGLELCHLQHLPKVARYKEGDIIAYSGNTGTATTAPHLHSVMHRNCQVTANYGAITAANYNAIGPLAVKQLAARNQVARMLEHGLLADSHKFFAAYA